MRLTLRKPFGVPAAQRPSGMNCARSKTGSGLGGDGQSDGTDAEESAFRVLWQALKGIAASVKGLSADYKAQQLWVAGMQRIVDQHHEHKRLASGQEPTDPGGDGRSC